MSNNITITENVTPRYIVYNEILPDVDRFFHSVAFNNLGGSTYERGEDNEWHEKVKYGNMKNYANDLKEILNKYIDERLKSAFIEDDFIEDDRII